VRCDVNCGINTREELARRDPAVADELRLAFGSGSWRYPAYLRVKAPLRAAKWEASAGQRKRVRAQLGYRMLVPLCECVRKHRPQKTAENVGSARWSDGQPLCSSCKAVVAAYETEKKMMKKAEEVEKEGSPPPLCAEATND